MLKWKRYDGCMADVTSRSGFNVIELSVVILVLAVFLSVFAVDFAAKARAAGLTILGVRGKDIYVSIIGANTEREPLGLPSVWPSDDGPRTNVTWGVECFNFSNSTDYFRYLYDEEHAGTEAWGPYVAGFDYSKLAGNGVPRCEGTPLTAACNAWIIAKNVRDDMDDVVPILITRNVDARSLASDESSWNRDRQLYFDSEWNTPFGSRGFIMVRKGGAIFSARNKYFPLQSHSHESESAAQRPSGRPLKYLTPTHEVTPNDAAYAECQNVPRTWTAERVKREWDYQKKTVALIVAFWTVPCLVVFTFLYRARRQAGVRPVLPVQTAVTGLGQCCAIILYTMLLSVCSDLPAKFQWVVFAVATIIQVSVIASALFARPDDQRNSWDGVKYVWLTVIAVLVIMVVMTVIMTVLMGV